MAIRLGAICAVACLLASSAVIISGGDARTAVPCTQADAIGEAESVTSLALRRPDSEDHESRLHPRATLYTRDTVSTVAEAAVQIRFRDDTRLTVGGDSRIVLDDYVYARAGHDRMALSLVKGAARFVTGKINHDTVRLVTPVATLGVRGTDFTVTVSSDGATLVSVREGKVQIDAADGETALLEAGEAAYVATDRDGIRRLAPALPMARLFGSAPEWS